MLSKTCPNCGTWNDPDFIRCYWCGSELGTAGRLGDKRLMEEFDFTGEALAAFDIDNAYIQGFADGMIFMGLFKKV